MTLADCPIDKWHLSASRLVSSLAHLEVQAERLELLNHVARIVQAEDYAGFLKILIVIAQSRDEKAKKLVAETLGYGLGRMDMPNGSLTAWGGTQFFSGDNLFTTQSVSALTSNISPMRQFSPIEYLVVWYSQKTQRPYLTDSMFGSTLKSLIELISMDDDAYRLYPLSVRHELENGSVGAFSRRTRAHLSAMIESWMRGAKPEQVVQATLDAA